MTGQPTPQSREYGSAGLIGIATPQANPTVEAEMRIMLPPTMVPLTVRLTCHLAEPADRLRSYLRDLPETLGRYDVLRPDVFGFACTGSSYLVPREEVRRIVEDAQDRFSFPIVLAADAMELRLSRIGARRIALVSPYPPFLSDAATAYWTAAGFDVAVKARVEIGASDTRAIYTLSSKDAARTLAALDLRECDAIVLSGTGMPTLPLVGEWKGIPVISSNQCLAKRLIALAPGPVPKSDDWQPRLAAATNQIFYPKAKETR